MTSSYSLGIEFSTQSVKLVVLDLEKGNVCLNDTFNYDQAFPEYGTEGGVLPSDSAEIRHTSPFMLIEAIDLAFKRLSESGIDMSRIKAVKTDGMQHCSVYANSLFEKNISALDPAQDLIKQIRNCISRPASPIWEDRSTSQEVAYLKEALDSERGISNLTGNRAELRFPASQILKWAKEDPEEYEQTSHIFILSSFITSILTGKISPVDTGDGWGSNLNSLDINNPGWCDKVISAVDLYLDKVGVKSHLSHKLGLMDHYDAESGIINPYFTEKYHINPEAIVLTGTGDNPATLLGCGGNIVVSLGSSYTVNGVMEEIIPSLSGEYNVFGYTRGKAMALSVITNGGKVQEYFLKKYLSISEGRPPQGSDWLEYVKKAGDSLLSPDEKIMLPYLLDESVPLRKKGIIRDGFSDDNAEDNIRALILSQVLSLRLHSDHLGNVHDLCIVGGGAGNNLMMQWIADAYNAKTYTIENPSVAAPLGCAISDAVKVLNISYDDATEKFIRKNPKSIKKPIPENVEFMQSLLDRYRELESRPV